MKWYVFAGFVAALLCCAFWTAVIVFEIITSRLRPDPKGVASVAPLLFFMWAARELYRAYRGHKADD